MKTPSIALFALVIGGIALAQGPLTPPPGYDPNIGPANALNGSGLPQATMKTLHQVEPRTPLAAGQAGVVQEANGGFTISATGSYYLTGNISVATGNGITITAGRVSLDMNGFTIASTSATPSGHGIELSGFQPGFKLKNGFINSGTTGAGTSPDLVYTKRGFNDGVSSRAEPPTNTGNAAVIENVDVRGCAEAGIYAVGGLLRHCIVMTCGGTGTGGATVEACAVTHAGGPYGIETDLARDCVVYGARNIGIYAVAANQCSATLCGSLGIFCLEATGCLAKDNNSYGIYTDVDSGHVSNCTAEGNLSGGILAGSINNCSALSNVGTGIYGRSISNCVAISNGTGVEGLAISNCASSGNDGHGIVANGGIVSHCRAVSNGSNGTGSGIRALDSVISFCHSYSNAGDRDYDPAINNVASTWFSNR